MISLALGLALLTAGPSSVPCSGPSQPHGHLQWSESAKIVAPNPAWQVEVHPVLTSDENQTPVTLHSCRNDGAWPLFTLERSAEIYWSPGSRNLLVVNKPFSGSSRLLFFSVEALSDGKRAGASDLLDRTVKQAVLQRLGEKRHIEFYLPQFVSWGKGNIVLAVGGATYSGDNGPMSPYCYGIVVNGGTLRVEDTLTAGELKAKFGAECRVSP